MSRIDIFGPRSSRDVRTAVRQTSHYNFRSSLTKRLELLRQNMVRAGPLRASEQYRERRKYTGFRLRLFVTQKCTNKYIDLQPSVSVRRERLKNLKLKGITFAMGARVRITYVRGVKRPRKYERTPSVVEGAVQFSDRSIKREHQR